jgi:hypothetical protein
MQVRKVNERKKMCRSLDRSVRIRNWKDARAQAKADNHVLKRMARLSGSWEEYRVNEM